MKKQLVIGLVLLSLAACGPSIKTERVSTAKGDALAAKITDEWLLTDTEMAVADIIKQIAVSKSWQAYRARLGRNPKLFVAEVGNQTSEPYFPVGDLNDELLTQFSASGDYVLVDAAARDKILKELTFQNDGMVDPAEAKQIGQMSGADLMIFGDVRMQPGTLAGKTIKEYTVNLRMTDIAKGVEVLRVRFKNSKYSARSGFGW
ncbi:hypothetical protein FACS1894186_0930 [Alphaproteobacteria bacterium]|nr:hypothetical protein FACS1894186_0930 [Alphaproteobacteria bacterium]